MKHTPLATAALAALLGAAFATVAPQAHAGSTLNVGSMSVDGLEVRDLACTLDKAPLLGAVVVVGALASQAEALNACAPEGAAYKAKFTWTTATASEVTAASKTNHTCVTAALDKVPAALKGTCTVTILAGDKAKAEAAKAKLAQ